MKKNIKGLEIQLELEGHGIVNFDGDDDHYQKRMFSHKHDNIKYAKKLFNNNGDFKIMIDSNCLRNAIFQNDYVSQNPKIIHDKENFIAFLASPTSILRGFLFAEKETNKKKSPITVTNAVQICDAKSSFVFNGRGGIKNQDAEKIKSDNSIFKTEKIGDIKYKLKIFIDIGELQFFSTDQVFDRYAMNPDDFELFKKNLLDYIPGFNSTIGYYHLNTSVDNTPELGFTFSTEDQRVLISVLLQKILELNIKRSGSYAKVDSLKIRLIDNFMSNKNDFEDIKSYDDIDKFCSSYEPKTFYDRKPFDWSKEKRKSIEEAFELKENNAKEAKKEKIKKAKEFNEAKDKKNKEQQA